MSSIETFEHVELRWGLQIIILVMSGLLACLKLPQLSNLLMMIHSLLCIMQLANVIAEAGGGT
jgi:hypothetical protein